MDERTSENQNTMNETGTRAIISVSVREISIRL